MRVSCYQCSATQTVSERQLEVGTVTATCIECRAELFIDESGRVFANETALAEANDLPSSGPAAELSDAYATIPLPPLGALGLNQKPRPSTDLSSRSSDAAGGPPRRSVATLDLDGDDPPTNAHSGRLGPTGATTSPPSRGSNALAKVPIPMPPVTRHGWMVFAGLAFAGLALGAVLSGDDPASEVAFDREAGLLALLDGAERARTCLADTGDELAGGVELRFAPSGEVVDLRLSGPVARSSARDCVSKGFEGLEVPAFAGPAVIVKRQLSKP